MSLMVQVRRNGIPVPGLFMKRGTEGDVFRFVGAETGHAQIIRIQDNTVLPDGRNRVVVGPNHPPPNNTPQYIDFVLGFKYFVGLHQLDVGIVGVPRGTVQPIVAREVIDRARQDWAGWANPPYDGELDPDSAAPTYFQETAPDVVRIVNPWQAGIFVFSVPHTSLQAVSKNRITVENQGDNRAIELLGQNDGIVFTAPDGTRYLLRIDNSGHLGVDPV